MNQQAFEDIRGLFFELGTTVRATPFFSCFYTRNSFIFKSVGKSFTSLLSSERNKNACRINQLCYATLQNDGSTLRQSHRALSGLLGIDGLYFQPGGHED